MQGERKRRMRGMVRMLYALSAWPQLYIYSTADYIIPHNAVALWMQVHAPSATMLFVWQSLPYLMSGLCHPVCMTTVMLLWAWQEPLLLMHGLPAWKGQQQQLEGTMS